MQAQSPLRSALIAFAFASACASASTLSAAVSTAQSDAPSIATRTTKNVGGTDAKPTTERGLTLRCWQFGRLILEEPVNANSNGGPGGSMNFTRPGDNRPLEVFSMGEAVCVIR
jgi:hypothetical protein